MKVIEMKKMSDMVLAKLNCQILTRMKAITPTVNETDKELISNRLRIKLFQIEYNRIKIKNKQFEKIQKWMSLYWGVFEK